MFGPTRLLLLLVGSLLVVITTSCGGSSDPTAVTSNTDPVPLERTTRSWWQQLFDRTGFIEGHVRDSEGRPISDAGFSCNSLDQRGDSNLVGQYTNEAGQYRCRGLPGMYRIEVYDPVVGGLLVSQDVEIKAQQTIRLDIVADPAQPPATPTATKKPG